MNLSVAKLMHRPAWLVRCLPFASYIAFLAINSHLAHLLPDPRWSYGIQIGAVAILLGIFAKEYGELLRPPRIGWTEWPIAIGTGGVVFLLWINLDLPLLTVGESTGFDPRSADGGIDWPLALVRIFGAAAVVPVMEELFWRSFILRWIDKPEFLEVDPRRISFKALLFSSLLFGFEHTLWFAGILAGLAYGWLYKRRGNLWSPIAAHATTNLLLGVWVLSTGNWQFW